MDTPCNQTTCFLNRTDITNETIELLNFERRQNFYPTICMMCITILLGMMGNIIVIYVYLRYFKRTPANTFIISLAVNDLVTCTLGLPYELVDLIFPYIHGDMLLAPCRICRFFLTIGTLASICLLTFISYERYVKICYPLSLFLKSKAKKMVFGGVMYGISMAVAGVHMDNINDKPTRVSGLLGRNCSRSVIPILTTVLNVIASAVFGFSFLANCFFYAAIVRTLIRRSFKSRSNGSSSNSYKIKNRKTTISTTTLSTISLPVTAAAEFSDISRSCDIGEHSSIGSSDSPVGYEPETTPMDQLRNNTGHTKQDQNAMQEEACADTDKRTKSSLPRGNTIAKSDTRSIPSRVGGAALKTGRLTLMVFTVNAGFLLCFFPHFVFRMALGGGDSSYNRLHDNTVDAILEVVDRSFTANSFINPIIYSCFNPQFRMHVLKVFRVR